MPKLRIYRASAGPEVRSGSASGSTAWVGAASGSVATSGSAAGSTAWSGAASGATVMGGSGSGSTGWLGAASGTTETGGSAAGTLGWLGEASGSTVMSGSASGTTAWLGVASGRMPAPVRDVTFLGFNEHQRHVTFTERQRVVTFGGSMNLSTLGVEFYDPEPATEPALTSWEASFDNGVTWLAPTVVDSGRPKWLLRGAESGTADGVLVTDGLVPLLRAVDNPEVIVRTGPRVRVG